MNIKALILGVIIFLILMGILLYAECGVPTPTSSSVASPNLPAAAPTDATRKTSAEEEIRAVLEEYYRIARTNDREALKDFSRSISSPEYRYSSELGVLDKEATFRLLDSMRVEFLSADFDEFEVQLLGSDAAVAKYRDYSKVRANGDAVRTPIRFTSVWVRRDGRWQIVAEHSSVLAPQKLLPRHPLADKLAREK